MSSTTIIRYHTVESVYRGRKNGWHLYNYVQLVANEEIMNGRQFAKAQTNLYVSDNHVNGAEYDSTIPGYFEVDWYIIIDKLGSELKPASLIWSHSDSIEIPTNLNANDYPDLVTIFVDEAFRKRNELKDKLVKLVEQKSALKQTAELQKAQATALAAL